MNFSLTDHTVIGQILALTQWIDRKRPQSIEYAPNRSDRSEQNQNSQIPHS